MELSGDLLLEDLVIEEGGDEPEEFTKVSSTDATPQELRLARKAVEAIDKRWPPLSNPVYQARVETIVNRLRPYMERELSYDVKVIDHKMVNAFALAGGIMYVTTGMLDFVATDLELAGVMAHEMVHADRKHVIVQMARNERMTLLALATIIASRGQGAAIFAANALQVAVMGAYSVDIEKEADAYGIEALRRAGYNPVGVLTLQERLQTDSLKRPHFEPGIYQTHPDTRERISAAIKYMENHNIPIQRKYSLGVLRARVETEGRATLLTIDGTTCWRGADDEETRLIFDRVAASLWENLQLETAPYDIRLELVAGGTALLIKGRKIVSSEEVPDESEPLEEFRTGIQRVLDSLRKGYPMADFYL